MLWLAGGIGFGRYLAEFATNYVTMYAGLASAMIALVFLYWIATIFVYGGELNAEILARPRAQAGCRRARARGRVCGRSRAPRAREPAGVPEVHAPAGLREAEAVISSSARPREGGAQRFAALMPALRHEQ